MAKKKRKNDFFEAFYSKNTIKYAKDKVRLLGVSSNLDPIRVLNIRTLSSLLVFVVVLYFSRFGYFIAPIVTIIYYKLYFRMFIDTKIEKRRQTLEREALYFFEILALSLEAGGNIKTAIEVTSSSIDSSLALEFRKLVKDVNFGKNLNDAIEDTRKRIPSDAINNILLSIKEANTFGNDIIKTVYDQVEYIRGRHILEAKAKINKIPVKISVVSVIFFIPLLILLLLGPMLINLISR